MEIQEQCDNNTESVPKKIDFKVCNEFRDSVWGQMIGFCERRSEHQYEFLQYMNNCERVKYDTVPCGWFYLWE